MSAALDEWLARLRQAWEQGTLVKLTLGAHRGADATLRNVFARRVDLRAGTRLAFVFRHATKDITKNLPLAEAIEQVARALSHDFGSAHLFTTEAEWELQLPGSGEPRLVKRPARHAVPATAAHDRAKARLIDPAAPWLQGLGVTNTGGRVREGMAAKFRQINKFVEILQHSLANLSQRPDRALTLVDMGCGKGYLTFAAFDWLRRAGWQPLEVCGVEARGDLVDLCNRVAATEGFSGLRFERGTIASTALERVDVLVALHACDTATDDAIARGIQASAAVILVAPCCHKELRPQLCPPPPLSGALKHGILRERQAEFATDALRAALLEWAGYETKVFEFIATEHTAKNLMIAAAKSREPGDREALAAKVRALAGFYGIRSQRLAQQLGFELAGRSGAAGEG